MGFISVVAIGLAAFTSELLPVVALSVALLNEFAMSIPIPALECITGSYSWLRRVISSIIILVSVLAAAWAGPGGHSGAPATLGRVHCASSREDERCFRYAAAGRPRLARVCAAAPGL